MIHADLPRNRENLLHRSGRTGRAGKKGKCILFFSPKEIKFYENLIVEAKIKPQLKKFISKEQIEKKDNEKIFSKIFSNEKAIDNEEIILQNILNKFSVKDIALAYIRNIKKDLPPIEDVDDIFNSLIDLKSKQKYINIKKGKKRTFKFKRKRKIKK